MRGLVQGVTYSYRTVNSIAEVRTPSYRCFTKGPHIAHEGTPWESLKGEKARRRLYRTPEPVRGLALLFTDPVRARRFGGRDFLWLLRQKT